MKTPYWVAVLLAAFVGRAVAQDHDHNEKKLAKTAEIRVYLADKNKKPVDLKGITAMVIIEPQGGTRKVIRTKLVSPKGSKRTGLGHGGEVSQMGAYHVEFLVIKPHDEHEHGKPDEAEHGHGKAESRRSKHEEQEHGQGKHEEHAAKDATPYFHGQIDLVTYNCGMTGHANLDKPGRCPKCKMKAKAVELEFSAVVVFRIRGESLNAKGFSHPPAIPNNYPDAVARIEEHLKAIEGLIKSNDLDKVHHVADKISDVCKKLPGLAHKDDKAEIKKLCMAIIALFKEIDKAADSGKKDDTIQALKKYKVKVAALRRHEDEHRD